jgi:hypothetical protein
LERDLLGRYHRRLIKFSVQDYAWDECEYDYRASIIRCLFFLLNAWSPAQWTSGIWWPRIQRGLGAFHEWGCEGLLE